MDGVMHPSVEQAIGRDRIRKAFKRYENNPADEHDRGIVRAVNPDGSYEVLLDGDVQTARCAPYAKAMVGDRVIVVTTKDGENVLLGRLGGEIDTISPTIEERFEKLEVDYIVAEGTSGIWTYRKWSSGIAECWGVKTVSVGGFSAWGGMYIGWTGSGSVDLPFEFAEVPTFGLAATSDTTSSLGIVAYGGSRTATPSLEVFRSNNPGAISVKYQFSVKGRWK